MKMKDAELRQAHRDQKLLLKQYLDDPNADPVDIIPIDKWTTGMHNFAEYIKFLAMRFMDVSVIDARDLSSGIEGLSFVKADASSMTGFDDDSLDSLSSLHAAEYFGLERYGGPIDLAVCFTFMKSLQRVLKPGGRAVILDTEWGSLVWNSGNQELMQCVRWLIHGLSWFEMDKVQEIHE